MDYSSDDNFSCDLETGNCGPSKEAGIEEISLPDEHKLTMLYYTDPICSSCWAIEPQLRKFKLAYGHRVAVAYKMGGLLPGWGGFADKANAISQPSDVAHHWDEVGERSGMSIDGDLWLEDPLPSSFPPCVAFKAAQRQGEELSMLFLRRMKEMVFLEKKNIAREDVLVDGIKECGGDQEQFLLDYRDPVTEKSFKEEMAQGRAYGVRGFPTFIFLGIDGKGFKISGGSGYDNYVLALEKACGEKITPQSVDYTELDLLKKYGRLATKEISVALSQEDQLTIPRLAALVENGQAIREKHKFGDFWRTA